jgi:hypothetical protein
MDHAASDESVLCEVRGGLVLRWGRVSLLGREVALPYFSASPPFAKLLCFPQSLRISVGPIALTIPLGDISEVRYRTRTLSGLLLGGETLTIKHRAKGSNPVVFGSPSGVKRVALALQSLGVTVNGV